ncbi:MAG: Na+/H+ antiporter subunit E [Planctomycetes bacterium]|nr:Na+/H+ antiporter subunit E [Planctomycetota bacterium]
MPDERRSPWTGRLAARAACYALAWAALTHGDPGSWVIGAPAVLLAALAGVGLSARAPAAALRPRALLPFVTHFLSRSLTGGVDVARRALDPRLPLSPGLIEHPLRLPPDGPAAVFFVDLVSLLPGTLCAGVDGARLTVHVIDQALPNADELRRLEERVAALFGEELAA